MPRTVFRLRTGSTDNIPRETPTKGISIIEWFEQQGLGDCSYINAIEIVETDDKRTDVEVEGAKQPHKLIAYIERYNTVHPRLRQHSTNVVLPDGLGGAAKHFTHHEVTSIQLLLAQYTDEPELLDEYSTSLPMGKEFEVEEKAVEEAVKR